MVWTGSATRHIRASLEGEIELAELRGAWAPLSLESYADKLARHGLELQMVLAERDQVVLPALSERLVSELDLPYFILRFFTSSMIESSSDQNSGSN